MTVISTCHFFLVSGLVWKSFFIVRIVEVSEVINQHEIIIIVMEIIHGHFSELYLLILLEKQVKSLLSASQVQVLDFQVKYSNT